VIENWFQREDGLPARRSRHAGLPAHIPHNLDLLLFPTIFFVQTGYSIYTLRQAGRRSWRIGQKEPVRVAFFTVSFR
jgi:hypothetical protein